MNDYLMGIASVALRTLSKTKLIANGVSDNPAGIVKDFKSINLKVKIQRRCIRALYI